MVKKTSQIIWLINLIFSLGQKIEWIYKYSSRYVSIKWIFKYSWYLDVSYKGSIQWKNLTRVDLLITLDEYCAALVRELKGQKIEKIGNTSYTQADFHVALCC